MLQQEKHEDFVIATGIQHSVREFVTLAANELEIAISWSGTGQEEKGVDQAGKCIVAIDPRYFRPAEVDTLLGDAAKANEKLGWQPKISFESLVREMVQQDLDVAERDELYRRHGFKTMDYNE